MKRCLGLAAVGLLAMSAAVGEVAIRPADKGFKITAAGYTAMVGADGCLTSLCVGGQEFLHSTAGFPRGAYLYDTGIMRQETVAEAGPTAVKTDSAKAALVYEFGDNALTLRITNREEKDIQLVIVFRPEVSAARGPDGRYQKAPLERDWEASTWFRLPARLTLKGGTRVWGPWSESRNQVWTGFIQPGATREITMETGMATAEEQARATEAANRVVLPPTDPTGPMWDLQRFSAAPQTFAAAGFDSGDERITPLFFAGPPYEGQPTQVFAWLGVPRLEPGQKVPGMVLVHGGGGTAFASWVKLWVDRGYAAIAMDTCGAVPKGVYGKWERGPQGGPPGWGGWGQLDAPREDQWTFHAVASALLAHSLLRAQPQVDADRIGVTGISWGGYLTSIIAGVDPRYKFACPVYGCGFTLDHNFAGSVMAQGKERGERWMRWWDPSAYLGQAKLPMLWVTGTNDFAYTFPALQKSYLLPTGPRTLAIRIRMPHGHGPAGEGPEEIHVFADSVLQGGAPLPRFTGQGREGSSAWASFEAQVELDRAELTFTKATGPWKDRLWEAAPAEMKDGKLTAVLPEGTTVYYFNLFDKRDCVVSTEHVELVK